MVTREEREGRKRESWRQGSYFCGGFGRVNSLESDSKELGKKEWIGFCGTQVMRLKWSEDYVERGGLSGVSKLKHDTELTGSVISLLIFFYPCFLSLY